MVANLRCPQWVFMLSVGYSPYKHETNLPTFSEIKYPKRLSSTVSSHHSNTRHFVVNNLVSFQTISFNRNPSKQGRNTTRTQGYTGCERIRNRNIKDEIECEGK